MLHKKDSRGRWYAVPTCRVCGTEVEAGKHLPLILPEGQPCYHCDSETTELHVEDAYKGGYAIKHCNTCDETFRMEVPAMKRWDWL